MESALIMLRKYGIDQMMMLLVQDALSRLNTIGNFINKFKNILKN